MSQDDRRLTIVVPHYNHHRQFERTLARLRYLELPMIVVDDGSNPESREALRKLLRDERDVDLIEHARNQGKGGAMMTALTTAAARGYTHAVQIDADGQHTLEDVPRLLALSRDDPSAIISALPVFAEDVPRVRLWGRKLTVFFNAVETLSGRVRDAMCGLRVYPLEPVCELLRRRRFSRRMQFDIQILVKADWADIPIRWVESPVTYPEDGLSHFHYLRDNRDITLMHIGLVFGMIPRIPMLLWRHVRPSRIGHD